MTLPRPNEPPRWPRQPQRPIPRRQQLAREEPGGSLLLALDSAPVLANLWAMMAVVSRFHIAFWAYPDLGSGPEQPTVRPWYHDEEYFSSLYEWR